MVGGELFSSEIVNLLYQAQGEHHAAHHRGQPLLPIKEIESFKTEEQQTVQYLISYDGKVKTYEESYAYNCFDSKYTYYRVCSVL